MLWSRVLSLTTQIDDLGWPRGYPNTNLEAGSLSGGRSLLGGFASNAFWCVLLNIKNRSFGDYISGPTGQQIRNYSLSALGGVIWYGQFFFYGMGTTKLGLLLLCATVSRYWRTTFLVSHLCCFALGSGFC